MFQVENSDRRNNHLRNNVKEETESNNKQSTSEEGILAAMCFHVILLLKIRDNDETFKYTYMLATRPN